MNVYSRYIVNTKLINRRNWMNGENNANDNGANRRFVENNAPNGVDEGRKDRTDNETGCDCSREGCSCAQSSHDEPQGDGGDVHGPTDISGDENAGKRAVIVKEIRSIADGIENNTLKVLETRGGKVMSKGKGKQPPVWTGAYGLEVIYK